MIDIHCHILPGIDDGPEDIRESVEMAVTACNDGIKTIVATPHIKENLYPAAIIREKVDLLNKHLVQAAIPVRILQGADVSAMIDPSYLRDYTIQGTDYILIEFPHSHLPNNAVEILFNIKTNGFHPIITHPERNPSVISNPVPFLDMLGDDSLVQITAGSLSGAFGLDIRECALYLLRKGIVSFIATDAHSNHQRRPILTEGLRVAEKIIGKEKALRLVMENPDAVINGRQLNVS